MFAVAITKGEENGKRQSKDATPPLTPHSRAMLGSEPGSGGRAGSGPLLRFGPSRGRAAAGARSPPSQARPQPRGLSGPRAGASRAWLGEGRGLAEAWLQHSFPRPGFRSRLPATDAPCGPGLLLRRRGGAGRGRESGGGGAGGGGACLLTNGRAASPSGGNESPLRTGLKTRICLNHLQVSSLPDVGHRL